MATSKPPTNGNGTATLRWAIAIFISIAVVTVGGLMTMNLSTASHAHTALEKCAALEVQDAARAVRLDRMDRKLDKLDEKMDRLLDK